MRSSQTISGKYKLTGLLSFPQYWEQDLATLPEVLGVNQEFLKISEFLKSALYAVMYQEIF